MFFKRINVDFIRWLCPFTTYKHRRESISLLFQELSVCVSQDFPLPEALDQIASSRKRNVAPVVPISLLFRALLIVLFLLSLIAMISPLFGNFDVQTELIVMGWLCLCFLLILLNITSMNRDFLRHTALLLSRELGKGKSLSAAMETLPGYFDSYEKGMVRLGEDSGRLSDTLRRIADYDDDTKFSSWGNYLVYPIVLLFFEIGLMLFVFFKIIPRFISIFEYTGIPLPFLTLWVSKSLCFFTHQPFGLFLSVCFLAFLAFLFSRQALGNLFFSGSVLWTLCGVVGLSFLLFMTMWMFLLKSGHPGNLYLAVGGGMLALILSWEAISVLNRVLGGQRALFHGILFRLPIVGGIYASREYSRFLFALGGLIEKGIPLPEALRIAGRAAGRGAFSKKADALAKTVSRGTHLEKALDTSDLMSPELNRTVKLSMGVGKLGETCLRLSEEQIEKSTMAMARCAVWFRSLLALGTGILVGLFAISMYLAIFSIPLSILVMYTD